MTQDNHPSYVPLYAGNHEHVHLEWRVCSLGRVGSKVCVSRRWNIVLGVQGLQFITLSPASGRAPAREQVINEYWLNEWIHEQK